MKITLLAAAVLFSSFGPAPKEESYDLVVYGATSSGVVAATAAAREGLRVALVEPTGHPGGLTAGGLGQVDIGETRTVGGLAREFFTAAADHYGRNPVQPKIESSVGERIFREMLAGTDVKVFYNSALARPKGVVKSGKRIAKIVLEDGRALSARYFIDATYVGDLMAGAGVSYTVGREGVAEYGESSAGIQPYKLARRLNEAQMDEVKRLRAAFPLDYMFYSRETPGDGDRRVQAYCYRLCVTDRPDNMRPFDRPANYDPARYHPHLARIVRQKQFTLNRVFTLSDLPGGKFDLNHMDLTNASWKYPEGSYAERKAIEDYHRDYQQGLLYFLAHDESVPEALREDTRRYGYARDEFADNGNWPYHLYVREARRMKGEYVMRQRDAWDEHTKPDGIGMGSYFMDCHGVERFITPEGEQWEEGEMKHAPFRPYEIPYRALTPRAAECENLLVTVCLSASHVIYGSLRMEPVFMITGHAAGVAAALAAATNSSVQRIDTERLREKLRTQGQILEYTPPAGFYIDPATQTGTVMDDTDAVMKGFWAHSVGVGPFLKYDYRFVTQSPSGDASAEYSPRLEAGRYEVQILYAPSTNRSTGVEVIVRDADGQRTLSADMTRGGAPDYWFSLGEYRHTPDAPIRVTVTNRGPGGIVVADGVRFIKK